MSTKTAVLTDKAPKPLPGIYSQAIIANGVVYCSGAVALDPATGKLIEGDIKAHTVSSCLLACCTQKINQTDIRLSTNASRTSPMS